MRGRCGGEMPRGVSGTPCATAAEHAASTSASLLASTRASATTPLSDSFSTGEYLRRARATTPH